MSYNTTIPPGKAAGCLPRKTRFAEKCSAFRDHNEVIPVEEWDSLLEHHVGLDVCVKKIKDQDGVGSCGSEAGAQGKEITDVFSGKPWSELNPWYTYHFVSGGVDRGSGIEENLESLRERGCASESVWPRSKGWRATPSEEAIEDAKNYRIDEYYDVETIAEFGTAIFRGFVVNYGSRGHAKPGVKVLNKSCFKYPNSWSTDWSDPLAAKYLLLLRQPTWPEAFLDNAAKVAAYGDLQPRRLALLHDDQILEVKALREMKPYRAVDDTLCAVREQLRSDEWAGFGVEYFKNGVEFAYGAFAYCTSTEAA